MEARPCPSVYDDESWEVASAFRVTLWEQPVRRPEDDRPRVGYAKMGDEDRWLHLAGWIPVLGPGPPHTLRRLERR